MTFSPLAARTVAHHNKYTSRQGRKVTRVIVHHWAGVGGGDARLTNPREQVSANYILYGDGTLVGQVPEEFRAWTSGSWEADSYSITVEVQNSGFRAPGKTDSDPASWPVSDKAYAKLIDLIADVATRYGWGGVGSSNVRGHREFASTSCPGGYLWSRLSDIRAKANAKVKDGGKTPPSPAPKPKPGKKTIAQLVDEVIAGKWGNNPQRREKLTAAGYDYAAVQAAVNKKLAGGSPAPAPKPGKKTTTQLVTEVIRGDWGNGEERKKRLTAAGYNYATVQAAVDKKLAGTKPAGKSISTLAAEVIRGDWGNDPERTRRLTAAGYDARAVQAEVNRRLA